MCLRQLEMGVQDLCMGVQRTGTGLSFSLVQSVLFGSEPNFARARANSLMIGVYWLMVEGRAKGWLKSTS